MELGQAAFQAGEVALDSGICLLRFVCQSLQQVVVEGQATALPFLKKGKALIVSDAVGPGVEFIRLLEGIDLGQDDSVAFLEHVLRVGGACHEGENVAVKSRLDPLE